MDKKIAKYKDKEYQFDSFMNFFVPCLSPLTLKQLQKLVSDAGNCENLKQLSIYKLCLSVRSFNILRYAEIATIGDLVNCTWWDLYRLKNCGKKSLQEIIGTMALLGFEYIDAISTPQYIGHVVSYQTPQTNSSQNMQSNNLSTSNTNEATIDDVPEKYKKYVVKGIAKEVKDELQNSTIEDSITTRLISKLIENEQQNSVLLYNKPQLTKVKVENTTHNIPGKVKIRKVLHSLNENVSLIFDLEQDFIIAHQDYLCDIVFNSNLLSPKKRELIRFIEGQCNTFNK